MQPAFEVPRSEPRAPRSPSSDDVAAGPPDSLGIYLVERVRTLLTQFPMRLTGTAGERRLQEACAKELEARGGVVDWHFFGWGRSIYQSLALHFGLATFATVLAAWAPWPAAALHVIVALSYMSESMYKRPLLRRMLPSVRSQSAIVTFASRGPKKRRLVTLAHADAAYTGILFSPALVKMAAKETTNPIGRAFRKGLALATFTLFPLAALEAARLGPWALLPAWLLTLPSLAAFVLNLDVVVRNRIVPAANDNLSGVVASLELAARFAEERPDGLELVIVITGAEEAGTGGASRLAHDYASRWSREETTVLALDTFSGGDPRLLQEGELIAKPLPPRLVAMCTKIDSEVTPYEIPSGATDAWPFLARGYEAMAVTCIDASLGAPRHYHRPSDTADNLDPLAFARTYRFTEALVRSLARAL